MEVRTLDLTIITAESLTNTSRMGRLRPYAVACIDPADPRTSTIDTAHGICPYWNFHTSFSVPRISFYHPAARLTVQIFHKRSLGRPVLLGTVSVPLTDLLSLPPSSKTTVCYQVFGPSGQPQGTLKLAVMLGQVSIGQDPPDNTPAMAYPAFADTIPLRKPKPQRYPHSSKPLPKGHPVVPYYAPPAPPATTSGPQGSGFGLGLLTGAVGGFLLGDAYGDANNGDCADGNFGGGCSWESGASCNFSDCGGGDFGGGFE